MFCSLLYLVNRKLHLDGEVQTALLIFSLSFFLPTFSFADNPLGALAQIGGPSGGDNQGSNSASINASWAPNAPSGLIYDSGSAYTAISGSILTVNGSAEVYVSGLNGVPGDATGVLAASTYTAQDIFRINGDTQAQIRIQIHATDSVEVSGPTINVGFVATWQIGQSVLHFDSYGQSPTDQTLDVAITNGTVLSQNSSVGGLLRFDGIVPGDYHFNTSGTASISIKSLALGTSVKLDSQITSGDILRGSIPPPIASGPTMNAVFKPNYGYSIHDAAVHMGFDHFNWVQRIVHIPAGWTLALVDQFQQIKGYAQVDSDGDVHGGPFDTRALDPIDSNQWHYVMVSPAGIQHAVTKYEGAADGLPYYWGEDPSKSSLWGNLYYSGDAANPTPLTASQILFSDTPSLTSDVASGSFLEFETDLVGVTNTGQEVSLPSGNGTKIRWKTNGISTTLDETLDGPGSSLIKGGVYDVWQDNVLGDTNGDGILNQSDMAVILQNLGQNVFGGYFDGDFNDDGRVTSDDLALFDRAYAQQSATLTNISLSIPEPSKFSVLAGSMLGLVRRRIVYRGKSYNRK